MRKSIFILAFMLLGSMGFAQSNLPFTSLKPFNKGNFKIDASYSRMMQKVPFSDYPDFRVGVGVFTVRIPFTTLSFLMETKSNATIIMVLMQSCIL